MRGAIIDFVQGRRNRRKTCDRIFFKICIFRTRFEWIWNDFAVSGMEKILYLYLAVYFIFTERLACFNRGKRISEIWLNCHSTF